MHSRPQFKRHFRWEIVPSEGVFLLSERGHFLLRGQTYLRLAPLLDGRHTEAEIVDLLRGQVSAPEVLYALEVLRRRGYVASATASLPDAQAAFWDMLDVDPEAAAQRLQETPVSLAAFGRVDPAPLQTALASLGIRVAAEGDLGVALADDYLQPGLEAFNRASLEGDRPWLLLKPAGAVLWLGPLFLPGQTGCWACLAHRLEGHRQVERYLGQSGDAAPPLPTALAGLPSTQQTAVSLAATEIARWIGLGRNPHLAGQIITLNTLTLEKQTHVLTRRPQCPRCGDPGVVAGQQRAPLALRSRPKSFTADGGHRGLAPQETFKRLERHLSPITGVASVLRRISLAGDGQGPTLSYVADHNFVLWENRLPFLRESLRGRSGGKGKGEAQARTSALAESIERYAGVFQGDEARLRARFKDLGPAAIHPNACMLYSRRQLENRARWNAAGSRFTWVPEPFDEDREIEWSPAWSLTRDEFRYIPTAYVYYGYAHQHPAGFTRPDANGCAAGNSKEEAILQGFMELVERDSVALWWYNRLRKPAVDLASFDEPYFAEMAAYYRSLKLDLWVLDLTGDLGVPAFAAVTRRTGAEAESLMFGFGAHFDPRLGVLRALTELNQLFPAVLTGGLDKEIDADAIRWLQTATLEDQPYLAPDETLPARTQADYPRLWSDDLHTDVMRCVEIARQQGLETLVLDQTRPDLGLDVVKVIVPGLRHFWARFGPGRLYQVPVQMGWLAEPLTEDELNPWAMFL